LLAGRCLRPLAKSRPVAAKAKNAKKPVDVVGKIDRPRGAGIESSVDCGKQVRQLPPGDRPHCGNRRLAVLGVQKTGHLIVPLLISSGEVSLLFGRQLCPQRWGESRMET